MPDVWTHYFQAKQVRYEQRLVIRHSDLFYLGAQGPDILFYQAFEPWKKDKPGSELAHRLHQWDTERLLAFVLERRRQAGPELADYLSGFLSHYALDATLHPLIHREAADGPEHKRLEMALDQAFYATRRGNQPIQAADISELVRRRRLPQAIVDFYVDLAQAVLGQTVAPEMIRQSYRDFGRFHRLSRLSGRLKTGLIEWLLKHRAPDYAHYFYGEYVSQTVIEPAVWQEYLAGFERAKTLFARLNHDQLPDTVVNFSGYMLENGRPRKG